MAALQPVTTRTLESGAQFLARLGPHVLNAYLVRSAFSRALWLLFITLSLHATPSYGADPWRIDDLAVLVDEAGTDTITSVSQPTRAAEFEPAPNGFSAGYTRAVHWLRFTLHAPPPDAQGQREILLEMHPPYVDDLQIYLPRADAKHPFDVRRGGDLLPQADKEFPYRAFVYRIAFDDALARTVYVRLQTTSSSVLTLRAWEPSRFIEHAAREYALLGLLFGLILAGLLANVWYGLWRREAIYRRYIVYLLVTLFYLLGINGLAGEYVVPQAPLWANYWVSTALLLLVIFGTRFYTLALAIDQAAPWMQWVYRVQLWLAVLCLPAPFVDLFPEALRVLLPLVLLMLLTGAWRSVQLWRNNNANGKALLLAHVFSLGGTFSVALTMLGVLPGQFWLIYGFQLGTVGTLLALQLMLAQHVRTIQAQQTQASIDTQIAKTSAQQERAEREQQRHFLSMLTHELKTPLSVIRMRLGTDAPSAKMQAHAQQAVDDINNIVDRCAMVSRLEDHSDDDSEPRVLCHIGELLRETLSRHSTQRSFALEIHKNASSKLLLSDPLLLRTILSNLIDNAVKYAAPDSTPSIVVFARSAEGRPGVVVRVENLVGTAGLPDARRVFEKYYRASGAHHLSGSGLGLYIVKALAEKLSGTIHYLPQDQRVVFELWLPQ